MNIGILESEEFSEAAIKSLLQIGKVSFYNKKLSLTSFLKDISILFVRLKYNINKDFLDYSAKLRFICSPTTGLNHIDLKEIERRNIKLISLKGSYRFLSNIRATPEHTFGLVLSLIRNYKSAFLNVENRGWDRDRYKGTELFKNKIGIIGFGRVGKLLAKFFKIFGAIVYFYDIREIKTKYGAIFVESLPELINNSNIVILSASYSDSYRNFFNKNLIDLLKDKYFINTSRGELIEEKYLISKIEKNYFKGIALDVIANEQGKNNLEKLVSLTNDRNFILTPHIAGLTYESLNKAEEFIAYKLLKQINLAGDEIDS